MVSKQRLQEMPASLQGGEVDLVNVCVEMRV